MSNKRLVAGSSRAIITPPAGVDLCGFGGRPGPSAGVHDDLRAGALYLASGGEQLLVLTMDLIGLHRDAVAEVRRGISRNCGIPEGHIMMGCSHTHSGPVTTCIRSLGVLCDEWYAGLLERLVAIGAEAKEAAVEAVLGTARVAGNVGRNRREMRDGRMVLGIHAAGSVQAHIDVVRTESRAGVPLAHLFCHAAHAVCLGGGNQLISGDWPGYAQRSVEERLGGAALFLQGCCGDINCELRGDFDDAAAQGEIVGRAVGTAVDTMRLSERPVLRAASESLALPLQEPPSVSEAREQVARLEEEAARQESTGNYGMKMMARGNVDWAKSVLRLAEAGQGSGSVPFEVQAFRIGDLALVGLPGEVFVDYALAIDEGSPFVPTTVAAYTNGNIGYVPTRKAFSEGGYEVCTAIRYYGVTMLKPDCEELVLGAARRVLGRLSCLDSEKQS